MASLAATILFITFVVNLGVFFVAPPQIQAPMIGLLQTLFTGNYNINWGQLFTTSQLIELVTIALFFLAVSQIISPGSIVTGNFATIHVPLVIATAIFITFFATPNFGQMGIPNPLGSFISIFFGFMTLMAIFDLFGGR